MAVKNGFPDAVLGELYPFEDRTVEVLDGLSMHYVEAGRPGLRRPTFLLVHGSPTWSFLWRSLIEPLSRVGRVVAVDLVGFGRSDHPEDPRWHTIERHADALDAFVDAVGARRIVPVLHEWGGPIGIMCAQRRRDDLQGLVMVSTWGTPEDGPRRPLPERLPGVGKALAWRHRRQEDAVEREVQALCATDPGPRVLAGYRHPFPNHASRAAVQAFRSWSHGGAGPRDREAVAAVEAALPRIAAPALVLHGSGDVRVPEAAAHRLRDLLPACEELQVMQGGHLLPEDAPEAMAEAVMGFLAARGRAPGTAG